jgi:hypothetical protein
MGGWELVEEGEVGGRKVGATLPCDNPLRPFADVMHFRFSRFLFLFSSFFVVWIWFLLPWTQSVCSSCLILVNPSLLRGCSRLVDMLRRRTAKDKVPHSNKLETKSGSKTEEDKLRAEFGDAKVKQLVLKPRSKRRNGFIFLLGGIFGIFIALFFANQHEVISLDSIMDLNLESLMEAIPQGILRDVKEFSVCTFEDRSSSYLACRLTCGL